MNVQLCPAQQRAFDGLAVALERGPIVCLRGRVSRGKSTILRALFSRTGGTYLTAREYIEAGLTRDPLALEESLFSLVLNKVERGADYVYLDDLGRLTSLLAEGAAYPRRGYFELALKALSEHTIARGRKLIYEEGPFRSREAGVRAFSVETGEFGAEDYVFLGTRWLGKDKGALVDFQQVHRFAPRLDVHQLNAACQWMFHEKELNTLAFTEYLRANTLVSNVRADEVATVDLRALEGLDEVVRGLAAQVVLPLENDQAVKEFALRPKRGVLLHGPSGTGKTTIGRALVHRLKSKLIKIDGTVLPAGPGDVRVLLAPVFELLHSNAPAVLFIDDAERLFEHGPAGACRYLLARLDGLENQIGEAISLVVTAQDPTRLPRELLTSGRIESWLETKLPGPAERGRLFQEQVTRLGESLRNVDPKPILSASEGFSAVEVRSAVEEAKALFAYDKLQNQSPRGGTAYLLEGVTQVAEYRRRAATRV
jgi:energy-coupling factor transporter ATP-binding protein EcfA2